jgi:peptide deformylase
MTIRAILKYPEPLLRQKAKPVLTFDENLAELVKDMAETMYDAPGIGLAAPQIGESIQVIVVNISQEEDEQKYMVMVNPQITETEGTQFDEEGCLSVPELTSSVKRYKKITVTYQTLDGEEKELITEDRFAVVLQHEIDHLKGILFIDHLSSLKRALYKKKVKKMLTNQ